MTTIETIEAPETIAREESIRAKVAAAMKRSKLWVRVHQCNATVSVDGRFFDAYGFMPADAIASLECDLREYFESH